MIQLQFKSTRRRARRRRTLNSCIDMRRASESKNKQVRDINQADNVHVVRVAKKPLMWCKQAMTASSRRNYDRNELPTISIKFCGKAHLRKKEDCPAWCKQCSKCGTLNHLAIKWPQTTRAGAVNMLAFALDDYLKDPDKYALVLHNSANDSYNGSYSKKLFVPAC